MIPRGALTAAHPSNVFKIKYPSQLLETIRPRHKHYSNYAHYVVHLDTVQKYQCRVFMELDTSHLFL